MKNNERDFYLIDQVADDEQQAIAMKAQRGYMSSWDFFGFIWGQSQKQKWWKDVKWHLPMSELMELIDPERGADRLYAYLKSKGKNEI